MASRATDSFARPDGAIGVADTGQPWVANRGTGLIKTGRALFTQSSPGAIYTVNTGVGGGDAYVDMNMIANDGGGQALYFRVVDTNRWWRLYKRRYTYTETYQSGTTPITYGYVGNGTYYYKPAGGWVSNGSYPLGPGHPEYNSYRTVYYSYDTRVGVYLGREDYNNGTLITYVTRTVYEDQTYQQTGGGEPIYSTRTVAAFEVRLDRCVNGAITVVKSAPISQGITSLGVSLKGDKITCYADNAVVFSEFIDATHQTAALHGIGHAETGGTNANGIEAFSAQPFVLTGYVPPVML